MSKAIRSEISRLEERHCEGCQQLAKWRRDHGSFRGSQLCFKECKIGKRILHLGDLIQYGRRTLKARELTKDQYLEHRDEGMTDAQMCQCYGIDYGTLTSRKEHWGIKYIQELPPDFTKARYLELKEQGISDEFVADIMGVGRSTITNYKRKWQLNHIDSRCRKVTHTLSGEEISPELYDRDIKRYKTKQAVAEAWGIGVETLRRRRAEWRQNGGSASISQH